MFSSKGAKRSDVEDIGVYSLLTNKYCMVYNDHSERVSSQFVLELSHMIPIIRTSIYGIRSIGSMVVGNSKGLLVSEGTTDSEFKLLSDGLPSGVKVCRVDERLGALGNTIVCNDSIAVVHPDIDGATIEVIKDVLMVDVIPGKVAGESLVGTYLSLTNNGALAHPRTSAAELDELTSLLQVPVVAGSVNRGQPYVGKGCVANDFIAFVGKNTTSSEISVIENVFKLFTSDSMMGYSESMRDAIIENL